MADLIENGVLYPESLNNVNGLKLSAGPLAVLVFQEHFKNSEFSCLYIKSSKKTRVQARAGDGVAACGIDGA